MLKITIYSTETRDKSGVARVTNKPYSMTMQTAYAHLLNRQGNPEPVPEKFDIILDKDPTTGVVKPYPVGEYQLAPSSFYMGQWGLELQPRLLPVPAAK